MLVAPGETGVDEEIGSIIMFAMQPQGETTRKKKGSSGGRGTKKNKEERWRLFLLLKGLDCENCNLANSRLLSVLPPCLRDESTTKCGESKKKQQRINHHVFLVASFISPLRRRKPTVVDLPIAKVDAEKR